MVLFRSSDFGDVVQKKYKTIILDTESFADSSRQNMSKVRYFNVVFNKQNCTHQFNKLKIVDM